MIPYGYQTIDQADIDAVVEVLKSDWLTQGPVIEQFQEAIKAYCNVKYALAVANGTVALFIACLALDIKPGDIVWTLPNTFIASANCAKYCGADVDFVDIDPLTYNISIAALKAKLEISKKENKLPKAIIIVHFAGQSAIMQEIAELSKEYDFCVIEDACHALGGRYKNTVIGSCAYSDLTIFSFHPVKSITTGEGGMITTNNKLLHDRMRLYSHQGITRDKSTFINKNPHPWYYEQQILGYNFRMTDMQAALGCSQLKKLDYFVKVRTELAEKYNLAFKGLPVITPYLASDCFSAWHLYVIRTDRTKLVKSRNQIFNELRKNGVGVNLHYIPIHLQPYYQKLGFKKGDFPEAENYYETAITLPLYPSLDKQDFIISLVKKLIE